jgi:hypothetical protein
MLSAPVEAGDKLVHKLFAAVVVVAVQLNY